MVGSLSPSSSSDSENTSEDRPKRKRLNLLQKLVVREIRGCFQTHDYGPRFPVFRGLPDRLKFPLKNLVPGSSLNDGHVFLGFTKDGQFVLSYTSHLEMAEFPFAIPSYAYRLYFWRFSPNKLLKKVADIRLFRDYEILSELFITVCQWPSDHSKILIHGFSPLGDQEHRVPQNPCYLTIAGLPPVFPCEDCIASLSHFLPDDEDDDWDNRSSSMCLLHGFVLHVQYHLVPPFPNFNPKVSLKKDGRVVLNTGDSLIALCITAEVKERVALVDKPVNKDCDALCASLEACLSSSPGFASATSSSVESADSDSCNNDGSTICAPFCTECKMTTDNEDTASSQSSVTSDSLRFSSDPSALPSSDACSSTSQTVLELFVSPPSRKTRHKFYSKLDFKEEDKQQQRDLSSHECCKSHDSAFKSHDILSHDSVFNHHECSKLLEGGKWHEACKSQEGCKTHDFVSNQQLDGSEVTGISGQGDCCSESCLSPIRPCKHSSINMRKLHDSAFGQQQEVSEMNEMCKHSSINVGRLPESGLRTYSHVPSEDPWAVVCVQKLTGGYIESVKENVSPDLETWNQQGKAMVVESGVKSLPSFDLAYLSPPLPRSTSPENGTLIGVAQSTPNYITCASRVFVPHVGPNLSGENEDEEDLGNYAYQNSLSFEVYWPSGTRLVPCPTNFAEVTGPAIVVQQAAFDVEPYLHETAQRLCSEAGQKYQAFTDYDVQIVDVFAETGDVLALAVMLVQATPKNKGLVKCQRNTSGIIRKQFETGFKFLWNIQTGKYRVVETESLREIDILKGKALIPRPWNPGRKKCASLQEKWLLPCAQMQDVLVLSNEPIFTGVSLEEFSPPSGDVAIVK